MPDQTRDQLLTQLETMRRRVAELETALKNLASSCHEALNPPTQDREKGKIIDFQWFSERAAQLKAYESHDLSELSMEDVKRLLRELQVSQVEVKMQNEELRRVHEQLIESRDKYSSLYDAAPVGYFTLNKEGFVLEANLTAAILLGTTKTGLVHKPFSSFVSKDSYNAYYWHLERVFRSRSKQSCEIPLVRVDGSTFYARFESVTSQNPDVTPRYCQTVISDTTDLKKAQQALLESEELHRVTLSSISDTVFISDDSGEFTYICPNVHVIFGYAKDEVQGFKNVDHVLGPNLFDPARLDHCEEIPNIERIVKDKAGREHVLLINVKRVSIKGGTTLFSCRDITERKQAELALQQSLGKTQNEGEAI